MNLNVKFLFNCDDSEKRTHYLFLCLLPKFPTVSSKHPSFIPILILPELLISFILPFQYHPRFRLSSTSVSTQFHFHPKRSFQITHQQILIFYPFLPLLLYPITMRTIPALSFNFLFSNNRKSFFSLKIIIKITILNQNRLQMATK